MFCRVLRLCRKSCITLSQSVVLSERSLLAKSTFRRSSSVVKIVDNIMLSSAEKSNSSDQQTTAKDMAETPLFDDVRVVVASSSEKVVHGGPNCVTIFSDASDRTDDVQLEAKHSIDEQNKSDILYVDTSQSDSERIIKEIDAKVREEKGKEDKEEIFNKHKRSNTSAALGTFANAISNKEPLSINSEVYHMAGNNEVEENEENEEEDEEEEDDNEAEKRQKILDNPRYNQKKKTREEKKAGYKLKRKECSARSKVRNMEAWNILSEEEQLLRSQKRKDDIIRSRENMARALVEGMKVCVDLSFDNDYSSPLHTEKESKSVGKQLSIAYGKLKKCENPVHLYVTSFDENNKTGQAIKRQGLLDWQISVVPSPPWEIFEKDDIIILSPDATEIVESFEMDKIYVIGGIVDRTVLKARTLDLAYLHNIKALRLPIKEYTKNNLSHILNIDTVINIISTFNELKNWEKTFELTIPLRKKIMGGKNQRKLDAVNLSEIPNRDIIDENSEENDEE